MWLLVIIVLSVNAPYVSRGTLAIPYRTQTECQRQLEQVQTSLKFTNNNVTASCTFRGYIRE